MPTKVKEIRPITDTRGERRDCPICNPRKDRVPYDKLWEFQVRTGQSPFKVKP